MKSKGGVKGLEITKADVIGETADIEIKFTFGDGSSKTEHEKLLKEKGDWKIGMG